MESWKHIFFVKNVKVLKYENVKIYKSDYIFFFPCNPIGGVKVFKHKFSKKMQTKSSARTEVALWVSGSAVRVSGLGLGLGFDLGTAMGTGLGAVAAALYCCTTCSLLEFCSSFSACGDHGLLRQETLTF